MKDFLVRPVPLWVAIALSFALLAMTSYASWQSRYYGVLAEVIRVSEESTLVKPSQSILRAPELCRAHWSYWPRAIYHDSKAICP